MIFKDSSILVNSKNNSIFAKDEITPGQEFIPLRSLAPLISSKELNSVLKEYQQYVWSRRSNFCGVCGTKTDMDSNDNCKVCPSCKERFYPALFPAVIVAITKGDKILLAHNSSFPGNMHSVIAGFVDLGEKLEETVVREVKEEVGLEVKNIKYFDSQNWGFTSSLMLGFTAEYKSGDIKVDNEEIDHADWYTKDNLPELPPEISIARQLINNFIDGVRK